MMLKIYRLNHAIEQKQIFKRKTRENYRRYHMKER